MDLTSFHLTALGDRGIAETYRAAITTFVGIVAAIAFLVAILGVRVTAPGGQAIPAPRPLAAPAAAADFPEQSHIAACWTLADQSNALLAPRSSRASDVVGPIYADACQGA